MPHPTLPARVPCFVLGGVPDDLAALEGLGLPLAVSTPAHPVVHASGPSPVMVGLGSAAGSALQWAVASRPVALVLETDQLFGSAPWWWPLSRAPGDRATRELFEQLTCPVLLMHGETSTLPAARRLLAKLPMRAELSLRTGPRPARGVLSDRQQQQSVAGFLVDALGPHTERAATG